MDKLNSKQLLSVELLIETLICDDCEEEDKDCSSCKIHQQIKENILNNCKIIK